MKLKRQNGLELIFNKIIQRDEVWEWGKIKKLIINSITLEILNKVKWQK